LKTQQRTFFECRELASGFGLRREHQHLVVPPLPAERTAFEHKLKVRIAGHGVVSTPGAGARFFTESLILAQDERWRRA
jgi:hypothetical protein